MSRLVSRRAAALFAALILGALIAYPLATIASHQFADVSDTNPYHNDIDALADAGVTSGCGGGNFCPSAFVTREQMAAFMNRLGALAAGKAPVVNATKLDGLDSTDFVQPGPIVESVWGPLLPGFGLEPAYISSLRGAVFIGNGAGDVEVYLPLNLPLSISGTTYGWAKAEVCFVGPSQFVTLASWSVFERHGDGTYDAVATDATDHSLTTTACFSLDAGAYANDVFAAAHAMGIRLSLNFTSDDYAQLSAVIVTWSPV